MLRVEGEPSKLRPKSKIESCWIEWERREEEWLDDEMSFGLGIRIDFRLGLVFRFLVLLARWRFFYLGGDGFLKT